MELGTVQLPRELDMSQDGLVDAIIYEYWKLIIIVTVF